MSEITHGSTISRMLGVRRTATFVLICWYPFISIGFVRYAAPLREVRYHSDRFPCEGSSCGCRNAEQCWRSCCCRTFVQRMEWSRREGVPAPGYVAVEADREIALAAKRPIKMRCGVAPDASADMQASSKCQHCVQQRPKQSITGVARTSHQSRARVSNVLSGSVSKSLSVRTLECQGRTVLWVAASPADCRPKVRYRDETAILLVPLFLVERYFPPANPPDTPPPECTRTAVTRLLG